MRAEELSHAVTQLNKLAVAEYKATLEDVLTDPQRSEEERLWRVGRLLGIIVKEPFAHSRPLTQADRTGTGAQRVWDLDERTFNDEAKQALWQYKVLQVLAVELPELRLYLGIPPDTMPDQIPSTTVRALAQTLHYERGFFRCLGASARSYLCGDSETSSKIDESVRSAGGQARMLSTPALVGAGSVEAANALTTQVPWLAFADPTLTAGFLIATIGLGGFCRWMLKDVEPRIQNGTVSED
jgi:hypothetical protein